MRGCLTVGSCRDHNSSSTSQMLGSTLRMTLGFSPCKNHMQSIAARSHPEILFALFLGLSSQMAETLLSLPPHTQGKADTAL